jgi:hypothetical protein
MSLGAALETEGGLVLRDLLSSGGRPSEMTDEQARLARGLFEDPEAGLYLFAWYICGLDKLQPDLHGEICSFLSHWGQPGWRRLMLMVPRGSFKTSLGSKALPLWLATKDPEVTIGIFNAAQEQAKSWIGSIRQILEGATLYHRLWPERLPPGVHYKDRERGRTVPRSWRWGDSGLVLVRHSRAVSENTFEPYGIGGASTGKHYTHRIMDDLVGETAAESPVLIEDAIHFVDHARALERPPNGGCELINCTPWAYRDPYSHAISKWPTEYKLYRRSLLENEKGESDPVEGESIFPQSISTKMARKMYETDPYVFYSQYQCQPRSGREQSFDRSWLQPCEVVRSPNGELCLRIPAASFDPERVSAAVAGEKAPDLVPLHWCDRAILVDPAPTKKGEKSNEPQARNGLVVVAQDPWGRHFCLQSVGLREDPLTVMHAVTWMAVFWNTFKIGIEEVNFSRVYAPLWNLILKMKYPQLDFRWIGLLTKGEDKDVRIRSLLAPHRERLWYYYEPRTKHILREAMEFPNGETRDLLDALAYTRQALSRPMTPSEQEQQNYSQSGQGVDRWTGY